MSYKFDSLISILKKLDQKEKVTVRSLMNDLEVSERTAYRYILTLQTAGFPIWYDRKNQSYCFFNNFSLGRPHLTVEETLALALSKKFLRNFGKAMESSIENIEDKLSVKKATIPKHIVLSTDKISASVGECLEMIHKAIGNFQSIEIGYRALYSNEETFRKVDPYYLFYHDGFWHLRGYCHLRDDFRIFVLDRIISSKVLNEFFVLKNISPDDELSEAFGSMIDGEPVEITLRFDAAIKPYVLRKKWHQSQEEKELKDGTLELRFNVKGFDDIKEWIYRWLPYVKVQSPTKLKTMVLNDLKQAIKKNSL